MGPGEPAFLPIQHSSSRLQCKYFLLEVRALVLRFQIGSRLSPNVRESGMAPVRAILKGDDTWLKTFPPGM
jgi:hypothetical protein